MELLHDNSKLCWPCKYTGRLESHPDRLLYELYLVRNQACETSMPVCGLHLSRAMRNWDIISRTWKESNKDETFSLYELG